MVFMKRMACILAGAFLMGQGAAPVQAQMDPVFTYQGQLKEAGRPYDGTAYLEFSLWDSLENGNRLGGPYWTSNGVNVENGLFTVEVDAMAFGSLAFNGEPRWLQIAVTDAGGANPIGLSPRQAIKPAPYALYALDGAGGGSFWSASGSDVYYDSGRVGIGTSNPSAEYKLHVASDGPWAVGGLNTAEGMNGYLGTEYGGVFGEGSTGVYGTSESAGGTGVDGYAHANTGTGKGVSGTCRAPSGTGVYGRNYASTDDAIGVRGRTDSPTGFGGYFEGRGYFSGNLGVGVSDPAEKLEVAGTIKTSGIQLTDTPVAGHVLTSDASGNGSWQAVGGGVTTWETDGDDNLIYNEGLVGIGIPAYTAPTAMLDVGGSVKMGSFQLTDTPVAGHVLTSDASGNGTWQPGGGGGSFSLPYNGSVTFNGDAFKVTNHGMSDAIGGSFQSTGDEGIGVYGKGGVDGYGGVFEGDTDAVAGVRGSTTRDNGAGVYATASSPNGWGLYAMNSATSGQAYGVFGRTQSTSGKAVWGEARGNSGPTAGVYGQARSPDGEAVVGHNAAGTGDAIGIYGSTSSPDGYAGYFEGPQNYFSGNVGIGTLFPESPLTVDGVVESKTGGFKFPDGTIQTSAGGGGGTTLWQAWEDHIYSPTANVAIGDTIPTDSVTLRIESGPDEYPLSATATYESAPWAVYAKSTAPYGVGLYAITNNLGPTWAVYGETSGSNGWGGYFIGKGYFSGNVGIGTTDPGSPLTVAGLVESTVGGFQFPDGSIQNTAATGGGSSLWSADATGINYQSGHVGIGTSSTTTDSLFVHGSGTRAIRGINDAPTGSVNGVEGSADSTSGRGVYGHASSSSGQAVGVLGETASPDGYGVWGYNDDDSLTGDSIGVYGSSNGTRGIGVKGHVFGSGGAALWGRHDGTAGTGVLAEVGAPSGTTYGVNAYVASPTGFGVYAFNEAESGDAVAIYGETGSPTGIAGYFDGRGYFRDNVGIGTTSPPSKLTVAGMIESTSLGIKFPDGTIQTTAAAGSSSLWQTNGNEIYYDADNVGVGVTDPHSTLHVAGGNWDVATGEGDFKIGTWTYRLKMGVATTGAGAGNCRIFAGGPGSKLTLGASGEDRLVVTESKVDVIGTLETDDFKLTTAPADGFVLTSDAFGNGTWQSGGGGGSFDLPYAGSVAFTGDALKITNTGTNMGSAISGTIQNATSSDASAGYFRTEGSGSAIYAWNDGGSATIKAMHSATGGDAIYATSSGDTGGYFTCSGTSGRGVNARASGGSGRAVWAEATGAESYGVYAQSPYVGLVSKGGLAAAKLYGNVTIYEYGTATKVIELGKGLDYAEGFDVSTDQKQIEPGTVLVIDPGNPGELAVSTQAYDHKVAGIVAGANGLGSGVRLGSGEFDHDVALAGRVYCNVVATDQPIEPGDLLTTSDVTGYAMKVTDRPRAGGAILGKAMEPLAAGEKGQILVLVTLQ